MTEEKNVMQDALVSIIQKTQQGIDASVSFLSEQIPDVIQQLLLWNFTKSSVIAVGCLVFLIFYVKTYKIMWNKSEELLDCYDRTPARIFYTIAGVVGSVCALVAGVTNLFTAMQIYIAPKVYLIEYAASLVK